MSTELRELYPPIEPHAHGMLPVGDGLLVAVKA